MHPRRWFRSDGGSVADWSVVGSTPPTPRAEQLSTAAASSSSSEAPTVSKATVGEEPTPALLRWKRWIRAFQKLRKLQRYFAHTGLRLQDFPDTLRDRLKKEYLTQK